MSFFDFQYMVASLESIYFCGAFIFTCFHYEFIKINRTQLAASCA